MTDRSRHQNRSEPIELPATGGVLIVLVGASGSGKTTFARNHFAATEILSSDRFRGMIADDEADQSVSAAAFDLLHHVARLRLERGRLAVVDATSATPRARRALTAIARDAGARTVALAFDVDLETCLRRDLQRAERSVGQEVIASQFEALGDIRTALANEDFDDVRVIEGADAIESMAIRRRTV